MNHHELVRKLSEKKAQILDDFTRAYLADRLGSNKKIDMRRVVLNEQLLPDGVNRRYYFTIKRGRLPNPKETHDTKA